MSFLQLCLGPVPASEPCAKVSDIDYRRKQLLATMVYRRMMTRLFPVPAGLNGYYHTSMNTEGSCDFYNLVLAYADTLQGSAFAAKVDALRPSTWDDEALFDLDWYAKSLCYYHSVVKGEIAITAIPEHYRGTVPQRGLHVAQDTRYTNARWVCA